MDTPKEETNSLLENILLFKIRDGVLLITPEKTKCDFSYVLSDNSKCFKLSLNSNQIDINEIGKVKYKISFLNGVYYLTIGAPIYPMTEMENFSSILDTIKSKKSLFGVNYAKNCIMKGSKGNGHPEKGGEYNRDIYAWCNMGSYLIFEFNPSTINYISFYLFDGDARIYTYTVEVKTDNKWVPLVVNKFGQNHQELFFDPIFNANAIRISGWNTCNKELHILENDFSIKYNFDY